MKILYPIFSLIFSLTLASCTENVMRSSESYIKWIENPENGCVKKKKFEAITITSFYKPPSYQVLKRPIESDTINAKDRLQELEKWYTFTLRIQSNSNTHPLESGNTQSADYFKKLEYYINAEADFNLMVGDNEEVPVAIYHMERNYGGAPYIDINLGFKRNKDQNEDFTLKFNDRVFSNGLIKFMYNGNEKEHLPKYNF